MPSKFFKWLVLGMVALFETFAAPVGGNGSGQGDDGEDGDEGGTDQTPDVSALPGWAQELITNLTKKNREVNQESKKRRLALDEAARREQERLAKQGEWQTLAEQRAKEVADLQPYQTRAQQLEALIAEGNKKRVGQIPEGMRSLVPQLPPEQLAAWLDANWSVLTVQRAPNTDAGAGSTGGKKSPPVLTPAQRAMARQMNMTDEAYAKRLMEMAIEQPDDDE